MRRKKSRLGEPAEAHRQHVTKVMTRVSDDLVRARSMALYGDCEKAVKSLTAGAQGVGYIRAHAQSAGGDPTAVRYAEADLDAALGKFAKHCVRKTTG